MSNDQIQLTPQQTAALEVRDVSIALSAGAGCGKTFVLTQRFLQTLRPDGLEAAGSDVDRLGGIVAITFTDRAAREMRDRIREACHAELARCTDEAVPYWLKILRGLDAARISTIHSFCGSLLRAHAVEAELDPQFGLLDGTTTDTFLRRVVTDTVQDLLSSHDEACMELVLLFGLERTQNLLRDLVKGRFRIDFTQFADETPESLAARWLTLWHDRYVPLLLRDLAGSDSIAHVLRLLTKHEPNHDQKEMRRRRAWLLETLPCLAETDDPAALLAELSETAKVTGGGGKKAWESETVYEDVKKAFTKLRAELKKVIDKLNVDEADVETAAKFSLTALSVTAAVAATYEKRKQELGLLDFDDLLLRTRDLLRHSETVRKRVASGIEFLMVDEFQDTDPVQAEIVRNLCGERLVTGQLFLVGDAKQSIYRFRRADPAVFSALRNEIPEAGRLPLSRNFRSQPAILHFVNCLFSGTMGAEYEPLVPHETEQRSPTPAIEFLFASQGEADEGRDTPDKAAARRSREADWLARRLVQLLGDPTPRIRQKNSDTGETELRPVRPGDMAILFRSLNNVAFYEEALRRHGLRSYLVGGRSFYAQQEIYDVVNLCLALDDRDDEVALAGVLRSPFFSLTDETLFALVAARGTLGEALETDPPDNLPEDQARQARHAVAVLGNLRQQKDRLRPAELLRLAVERTGYDAALLTEFLGRRKLANLNKLIDMARQFDRSGLFTLKDFVIRLRDSITEQTREEPAATHPESSDVIRLMTIHQSKGLEFPVVVVADMDWSRGGGSSGPFLHPELGPLFSLPKDHGRKVQNLGQTMHEIAEAEEDKAETTRLLYVAVTRAADYLILSAGLKANRRPASPWLKLLAGRFALDTGLPAVDPNLGRISLGDVSPDEIPDIAVHHSAPEIDHSPSRATIVPLSEFRSRIEQTPSAPWPITLDRLPLDRTGRRQFSVSEIERADAQRRSTTSGDTDQFVSEEEGLVPGTDAAAFGTIIHAVLQRVDLRNPASMESVLDRCLSAQGRAVDETVRRVALSRLEALAASSVFAELAAAKRCFRELDFLLRRSAGTNANSITISGQIDSLLEMPDGTWMVIDYKTGRIPSEGPQGLLQRYDLQLALYAMAVREMIGRLPDSVELVLIHDHIERIPFPLTDDVLADIGARVDAAITWLRSDLVTASRDASASGSPVGNAGATRGVVRGV